MTQASPPDPAAPSATSGHGVGLFLKGGAVSLSLAVTAVAYLVAYAILARDAGIAVIGLWGIIASFFQYGRVIDLGAGAAVLARVSPLAARGDHAAAAAEVEAGFRLSGLAALAAAALVSAGLWFYCRSLLTPAEFAANHIPAVLAANAVALVLMSQGSLLHAAIDAHNRAELRALLVLAGSVIFAVLAIGSAARFGILGIALAQLAQWLFLWLAGRILLARLNPAMRIVPRRLPGGGMRAIAGQGWQFQAAALLAAFLDPAAKALAAGFGGLAFAGQFEILIRIVAGGRTIFANGFQVLSPATARLDDPAALRRMLAAGLALATRMALLFAVAFAAATPAVMRLVAPESAVDLRFVMIFVAAWAFNLVSGPSYFAAIGLGLGRLNLQAHLAMAAILALLGPALGFLAGGIGVVAAYCTAIAAGSFYSIVSVNRRVGVSNRAVARETGAWAVVVSFIALGGALWCAVALDRAPALAVATALAAVLAGLLFGAQARSMIGQRRARSGGADLQGIER